MSTALNAALDSVLGTTAGPTAKPAPPRSPVPAPAPSGTGLMQVRLEEIQPNPDNPRERLTDIAELADSIRENGLIQPLIVRRTTDGRLELVAGHRRFEAVKRLGWFSVEVIIRKDMPPDDVLAAALVENGQRAGLDPIEEARALLRLKTVGNLSDVALAKKVGRSQPTVSARLALLSLPPDEQEALRAGQTTIGAAVLTARVNSGKVRKKGVDRAWHLGPTHALHHLARARCRRLAHKAGRMIGGVACGLCWESVIRSDERERCATHAISSGTCGTCGQPTGTSS